MTGLTVDKPKALIGRLTAALTPPWVGPRRVVQLSTKVMALFSELLYGWYTRQLMAQVRARPLPRHVAMILDGNRRFARRSGLLDVTEGHRSGVEKVSEVIRWCDELEIPEITLWGLSVDNLKRSPEEVEKLCQIIGDKLEASCRDQTAGSRRRYIRVVGRVEDLPERLRQQIQDAERQRASCGPWLLNVALGYGGRDEILDAFRRLLRARGGAGDSAAEIAETLSPEEVQQHLYVPDMPDPELIIRTSGETRLSGFLLWQSVYSELYFCDALWPAFRKLDFLRALRSFQARRRRFGR